MREGKSREEKMELVIRVFFLVDYIMVMQGKCGDRADWISYDEVRRVVK